MAYLCYKAPGSCENCEHFRLDPERGTNACFAQVDAITNGADYEIAFYRQIDMFDRMCGGTGEKLGLAIRAKSGFSDDFGLPEYSIITVNLPGQMSDEPEFIGMKNCAYMDINNSAALFEKLKTLQYNGEPVAKDTGFYRRSGFGYSFGSVGSCLFGSFFSLILFQIFFTH